LTSTPTSLALRALAEFLGDVHDQAHQRDLQRWITDLLEGAEHDSSLAAEIAPAAGVCCDEGARPPALVGCLNGCSGSHIPGHKEAPVTTDGRQDVRMDLHPQHILQPGRRPRLVSRADLPGRTLARWRFAPTVPSDRAAAAQTQRVQPRRTPVCAALTVGWSSSARLTK
jgi:hypothetical protein